MVPFEPYTHLNIQNFHVVLDRKQTKYYFEDMKNMDQFYPLFLLHFVRSIQTPIKNYECIRNQREKVRMIVSTIIQPDGIY